MAYFSRLTDIVTCNLTEILSRADDPRRAIEDIIREMDEGLAGAKRSVANATASEQRIHGELEEQQAQAVLWASKAKSELQAENEDRARLALTRKQEVEDVIAGLKQQHQAAISTREHLTTALRALEARLAEARRKSELLKSGVQVAAGAEDWSHELVAVAAETSTDKSRAQRVEDELAALKRELGK